MTTEEVRRVRYTQVIKDPFPEHSSYQALERSLGLLGRRFFKFFHETTPEPERISIWRAYQMGYDKAYEEMLAAADLVSTTRNIVEPPKRLGPYKSGYYAFGFIGGNQLWVTETTKEVVPQHGLNWFFIEGPGDYWVTGTSVETLTVTQCETTQDVTEGKGPYCSVHVWHCDPPKPACDFGEE